MTDDHRLTTHWPVGYNEICLKENIIFKTSIVHEDRECMTGNMDKDTVSDSCSRIQR